jgi:hypothetical protein
MRPSTSLLLLIAACPASAAAMERVKVAPDSRGFVLADSGRTFVPWGFNYDHDGEGRLIEDYWDAEWPAVESDFGEMKALGANVVRVHLQFGAFMESPTTPRAHALSQLARLVGLAEQTGLYLDVTGLGCYHKHDVPPWYTALDEDARWQAHAVFWGAVAEVCRDSPAIFCFDLMNEPVVAGGDARRDDWLGPAFGGKHFVQFINLERAGRDRAEIARQWIERLVAAIRRHDQRRLITVGLVPWSLDRPGLTSGFAPEAIADQLDFVAVHLYPKRGKLDEALDTLQGFAAAGKPVVIEETFPLECDAEELGRFIERSRGHAAGWIGFYWGRTPDELRPARTMADTLTLDWLELFQRKTPEITGASHHRDVTCAGSYRHHLQGICVDHEAIYWSFTTTLVKTDLEGTVLVSVPVANHHGDLCHVDGRIYVAVNLGRFNDPAGKADSWVYVYDAASLAEVARHEVQEVFHGAGGIGVQGGHFFVVGGLPAGVEENSVYEYDEGFRFVKRHVIASGHTHLGIQTATFAHGRWWFGCYGQPQVLIVTDAAFRMQGRHEFDCSLGIEGLPEGRLLAAGGRCDRNDTSNGCTGFARIVVPDSERGLEPPAPTEGGPR